MAASLPKSTSKRDLLDLSLNSSLKTQPTAGAFQLYCLGLTIVIGGQFFSWNEGLKYGFYPMFVATLLMGSAYMCMVMCIAEMTSTLPFSGGTYGFVRVALGSFVGAMVGYSEMILNICYVSSTLLAWGQMWRNILQGDEGGDSRSYEVIFWAVFIVTSIVIHFSPSRYFWSFNVFIAVVSLLTVIMYLLATAQYINYPSLIPAAFSPPEAREYGMAAVMGALPLTSWWYVGVEMLPLAANESIKPRKSLPMGLLSSIGTLFATSLLLLFCVCAQQPGPFALARVLLPFNAGFSRVFGISSSLASLLSVPAVYGTAFGFQFNFSRQMASMMRSRLLPSWRCGKFYDMCVGLRDWVVGICAQGGRVYRVVRTYSSPRYSQPAEPDSLLQESDDVLVAEENENEELGFMENDKVKPGGTSSQSSSTPPRKDSKDSTSSFFSLPDIRQSLLLGTLLALLLTLLIYLSPNTITSSEVFLVCIFGGYIVYMAILVSYIVFKRKYDSLVRDYRSPLGIYGACYALVVYFLSALGVLIFHSPVSVAVIIMFLIVAVLYYWVYARHTQCFSDDEQKVMFSAYIINVNHRSKKKNRKGRSRLQRALRYVFSALSSAAGVETDRGGTSYRGDGDSSSRASGRGSGSGRKSSDDGASSRDGGDSDRTGRDTGRDKGTSWMPKFSLRTYATTSRRESGKDNGAVVERGQQSGSEKVAGAADPGKENGQEPVVLATASMEDSYSLRGSGDEGGSERDSGSYRGENGEALTPEERRARRKRNLALKLSGKLQRRAIVETLSNPYTNTALPTIPSPGPVHADQQEDSKEGVVHSLLRGLSAKIFPSSAEDTGKGDLERKLSGESKRKVSGGDDRLGQVETMEDDDDNMVFSMRQN